MRRVSVSILVYLFLVLLSLLHLRPRVRQQPVPGGDNARSGTRLAYFQVSKPVRSADNVKSSNSMVICKALTKTILRTSRCRRQPSSSSSSPLMNLLVTLPSMPFYALFAYTLASFCHGLPLAISFRCGTQTCPLRLRMRCSNEFDWFLWWTLCLRHGWRAAV